MLACMEIMHSDDMLAGWAWDVWHAQDLVPPPDTAGSGNLFAPSPGKAAWLADTPFLATARPSQRPPRGARRTWLFLAGRGAGKTRAGAEWLRFAARHGGCGRMALVGPTLLDVREVMIEGVSGLKAVAAACGEALPRYEVSRRRLVWDNDAEAHVFSSEDPDSLRGPQFDAAWCDEAAAWSRARPTWDMLQMALRIGTTPRAVVTTTPRPVPLIRSLVAAPSTVVTRARTVDNADHLAPGFLAEVTRAYGGTDLGRQELDGELLETAASILFTRQALEMARSASPPGRLDRVLVAVDPPASLGAGADACGIVAAGAWGEAGGPRAHVLADATAQGLSPMDWGRRASALAAEVGAHYVLAEANQGGEMVRHTLHTAGCPVPVRLVRATVGKRDRAAPVSALYAQGRVGHAGGLEALETQMSLFGTDGLDGSPDRVDALVWVLWALLVDGGGDPRVRRL